MTDERWLRILQLVYQGLNLIAKGIKREIDEMKGANASADNSSSL